MEEDKQLYTIIMRHDTSTQWAVNNPILTLGEYAVEDDTHRVKRGDGETEWNDLPYEEFGLVYLVTYKNLSGEVSDNPNLQEALDTKMSIAVFEDVNYQSISSIDMIAENGAIGKITKISKNINNATTDTNVLLIKSADNSIQGYWSIDDKGVRILNLTAESSITDYEAGHMYYRDQLCYYKNRLYRAVENFEAEVDFNPIHWVILASKHAEDIAYDNLSSELDADNVQSAVDELKRRNDTKVSKTTEHRVVYGTTNAGAQIVIPIDDLRTVDTVNGIPATDQETKNIQIDAKGINYDDGVETPETIKEKLDQKVDKNVAGEGAKIIRDVQFNYNPETGHITLVEDKFSLEDGSSVEEEVEIDVVSEQEMANEVRILNNRIDQEVQTLNNTINTKETALYNTINTKETEIYNTINTKEDQIYNKILDEHNEINTRVDNEVTTLNNTIGNLDAKVDNQVERLDGRIDNLTEVVANNKTDIEGKLDNAKIALNNRIDQAVNTLNNTILRQVDILNDRIDTEVNTLNTRVDNEVSTLNTKIQTEHNEINARVDTEVADLNTRVDQEVVDLHTYIDNQDNLKIDKNISEYLITAVDVATHDSQPTIRVTSKQTETKSSVYDYVHFVTAGLIKTRMEDADHLVIDSTDIDTINTQQNSRLTNAENRLDAHDTSIASLMEHDVNHDRTLATHTSQIANHETRLDADELNIETLQQNLETEATTRENADNVLSGRIATNAVNITTKADKEFADLVDDKVIGKIESDTIANNELINLKNTYVSPVDGSISTENIKIISSDNTVIAIRNADGTIDLATNLDTDVNYFVTTDIINTTIASETVLDMNNLTATDKQVVEIQDIISDPEGTWGRVKSIDTTANTCTVVTFKKHAQAVWGTIKGTLADQTDLQTVLTTLQDNINNEETTRQTSDATLQTNITAEETARTNADNTLQENINTVSGDLVEETTNRQAADTTLQNNIDNLANSVNNLDTNKVDKVSTINMVYGTDNNGDQTTYNKDDLRTVDTINNISADNNKNIQLDASNINLDDTAQTTEDLQTVITHLITDLQTHIQIYTQDTSYTTSGNYVTQKYVTISNNDGVTLMAKVLTDFTSNNTEATVYESFIYDVEHDNLQLIGIPEEVSTNN